MKKINNISELKRAPYKMKDYFISFGVARSSKQITWLKDEKKLEIFNLIDGTIITLSPKELNNSNLTNIGEAIRKGAFFAE